MNDLVGFAAHTIKPEEAYIPWKDQERRNREMLSHALNLRDTILFIGSGCSIPLGYPSWQELADKAISVTEEKFTSYAEFLGKCKEAVNNRNRATDLSFILGACESVWKQEDAVNGSREYRRQLADLFMAKPDRKKYDPYKRLLELPVRRFVTSNYDCALEHTMVETFPGLCCEGDYIPDKKAFMPDDKASGRKSFTQDVKYDEQLAIFAMGYADHDRKIFHCHGWCHEPESMVLTESDYQRWYLRDQFIGSGRFRQTIDLIFGSNPILFVGFGLRDDDLLYALRMFSAIEPEQKHSRPLFALVEKDTQPYAETTFEQLYDRYGIHVVSYPSPTGGSAGGGMASPGVVAKRAEALCNAIDTIQLACKEHRGQWLQKPKFKKIQINAKQPQPYFHYKYVSAADQTAKARVEKDPLLEALYQEVTQTNPAKVIVLYGPGGTGKSWVAMQLLERLAAGGHKSQPSPSKFHGLFFWSSYYTDDALNGTDRALLYLEAPPSAKSRVDRLLECLKAKDKKYLLVFDGIERFLEESGQPGALRSNNGLVSRFLRAISSKESKSTVILTSRFMPLEFQGLISESSGTDIPPAGLAASVPEEKSAVDSSPEIVTGILRVIQMQGFSVKQVQNLLEPNSLIKTEQVPSLVSWLDGHRYGIALALKWLQKCGMQKKDPFDELRHHMSQRDPEQRVSRMIGLCLESLTVPARQLLEKLAIFMTPISRSLAQQCVNDQADLNELLLELTTDKILFEVDFEGEKDHYIVHPTVREYVFHRIHNSSTRDLPNLSLSGFTSGLDPVYPGDEKGKKAVTSLFKSLLIQGQKCIPDREQQACTDAFSVLRSRMVVNAVPRWTRYEQYIAYLASVIDLARKVSPGTWDYAVKDAHQTTQVFEHANGPLYSEEVAWLYNEAGLAYYSEGSILDAIAVWEQGYEINKILDSEQEGGQYLFQSLCNLGAANINFGRLRTALAYLQRAVVIGKRLEDQDHLARVEGYIALVNHLQGNLAEADHRYDEAIKKLHLIGNTRAESIFLLHHSSLMMKNHKLREASMKIQSARALAEAGNYPDLVAYARLSQGHIHRSRKQYFESIRHYRIALSVAKEKGIGRLEAEAQSELARVALNLGDAQVARRRAMKALQIANEHTLGLRQTHAMVVLGLATVQAGERELGIYYLKHAKKLAERQEYRLRGNEAEAELHALGVSEETSETESSTIGSQNRAAGA